MRAVAAGEQSVAINAADVEDHIVAIYDLDDAIPVNQTRFRGLTIIVEPSRATSNALDSIHADFIPWEVERWRGYVGEVEADPPNVEIAAPMDEPPTIPATPVATSTDDGAELVSDRRELLAHLDS